MGMYGVLFSVCMFPFIINAKECCDVGDIVVGCPDYTVDTQFRALFLKPSTNNLYYAAEAFPLKNGIAVPLASPNWQIFDLHPTYHFGFDLGLHAIIHSRRSGVFANWEHFSSTTHSSHSALLGLDAMVGPLSSIGPDSAPYEDAFGEVTFHFNEFNIRYGQYIDLGEYLQTVISAGVSVAQVKQDLITIYATPSASVSRTTFDPSSFTGAGPLLSFDFAYTIGHGFKIAGQTMAALLMGTAKNRTIYSSAAPLITQLGNPYPNVQNTCVENRIQMIPSFTERLGFMYYYHFCDDRHASIEVGFEAKILLNVIQSTDLSSGVIDILPTANEAGVFARTFARTLGNFSLGGPYIAFDIAF